MPRAFIAVGSNVAPEENVREAVLRLGQRVKVTAVSTFYRTEPEGRPDQPPFYNGLLEIETDLSPKDLKYGVLRPVEDSLGRVRSQDKYAPRTIDLDVIVYDELVSVDDPVIPDPQIRRRPFLAVPLCELAPDLVLPGEGVPVKDMAAAFSGHSMEPLPEYTAMLRKEVVHGL